ncbi:MAG TPA: Uma2 family endonuclease [Blastocatellia bacterium]|nr:Uma2 family endonuclease [Blastocatellia bacterium]
MRSTQPRHYTPEEYLEMERAAEFKSEYLEGQIYAMSGGSRVHARVTFSLYVEVGSQLKPPCFGMSNDMKVRTSYSGLYAYPDLIVVCGEPVFHDEKSDVLLNPKVIFEVLSPSTETYDRTEKFFRYQMIESFTDYVLIAQSEPRVEHFSRHPNSGWVFNYVKGLDNSLCIDSIGCTLELARIYSGVEFSETPSSLANLH